jgi:hypothetical protein
MNPRDNLDLAEELCDGIREVDWRTATSRAYFTAFHEARLFLGRLGFVVPRADQAHAYLWLRLANCGQPDLNHAGANLQDLRRLRNWADYDNDRDFEHSIAFDQVLTAAGIIQLLDAASATPSVLGRITDAIKIYERDVLRHITWRP